MEILIMDVVEMDSVPAVTAAADAEMTGETGTGIMMAAAEAVVAAIEAAAPETAVAAIGAAVPEMAVAVTEAAAAAGEATGAITGETTGIPA